MERYYKIFFRFFACLDLPRIIKVSMKRKKVPKMYCFLVKLTLKKTGHDSIIPCTIYLKIQNLMLNFVKRIETNQVSAFDSGNYNDINRNPAPPTDLYFNWSLQTLTCYFL